MQRICPAPLCRYMEPFAAIYEVSCSTEFKRSKTGAQSRALARQPKAYPSKSSLYTSPGSPQKASPAGSNPFPSPGINKTPSRLWFASLQASSCPRHYSKRSGAQLPTSTAALLHLGLGASGPVHGIVPIPSKKTLPPNTHTTKELYTCCAVSRRFPCSRSLESFSLSLSFMISYFGLIFRFFLFVCLFLRVPCTPGWPQIHCTRMTLDS